MAQKKLYRSQNSMLGGVCAGIANYFDVDPTIIRLLWVFLTLFTACFPGIILYIIALCIIPKQPFPED